MINRVRLSMWHEWTMGEEAWTIMGVGARCCSARSRWALSVSVVFARMWAGRSAILASTWRIWKDCSKGCARPLPGNGQSALRHGGWSHPCPFRDHSCRIAEFWHLRSLFGSLVSGRVAVINQVWLLMWHEKPGPSWVWVRGVARPDPGGPCRSAWSSPGCGPADRPSWRAHGAYGRIARRAVRGRYLRSSGLITVFVCSFRAGASGAWQLHGHWRR